MCIRTNLGDAAFIGDGCPWLPPESVVPPMRKGSAGDWWWQVLLPCAHYQPSHGLGQPAKGGFVVLPLPSILLPLEAIAVDGWRNSRPPLVCEGYVGGDIAGCHRG